MLDFKEEFKKCVINDFIKCYENCKTPNPCIQCNKYIKFGLLYKKAKELGCDYIATGHYAKIEYSEKYQEYVLKKSNAKAKDQTYFLYGIPKEILSEVLFPLAEYLEKSEIRKIAKEKELKVAEKSDSQEVCFIPNNDYGCFLEKNLKEKVKMGNIVLTNGEILGKHKGLIYYTVGQRKGLGISFKEPLYVIKLDKDKNELVVGTENELYQNKLYANDLNFLIDFDKWEKEVFAKIRYRAKEAKAIVKKQGEKLEVIFEKPQRAITSGQSVVFYDKDDIVLRWRKNNLIIIGGRNMALLKEFKEFAMKGNALDLAIGVVIGGAFQKIVNSLVNDIIMPLTSIFTGNVDYSEWKIVMLNGRVELGIGSFINAVISFLVIAFSIFLALKYVNKINKKMEEINKNTIEKIMSHSKKGKKAKKEEPETIKEPTVKVCPYCLSEIPYKAVKCAHCSSDLTEKIEEK